MKSLSSLLLILLSTSLLNAQHLWERHNPGGGGAFSSVSQGYNGDIYVASDLSGVYKSINNGQSWEVLGSEQGLEETHIATFGFVENAPNTVLFSTGWGIYKTTDGGNNIYNTLDNGYIEDAELAPSNPQIGYAAYHEDYDLFGEIYKTADGGENWIPINTNLPENLRFLKIIISPDNQNTVYLLTGMARFACSEAHLFKSTNGGFTWNEIGADYNEIIDFRLAPQDANTIYITTVTADCANEYYFIDEIDDGALYKSTNGGDSFTNIVEKTGIILLDENNINNIKLIDPRFVYDWNDEFGTWSTTNGGTNWSKIATWDDYHIGWSQSQYYRYNLGFNGFTKTVVQSISNSDNIFWANAQFINGSFDGGHTFENLVTSGSEATGWTSTGCDNIVGHALEAISAAPNTIYMGGYDIGLWRSDNAGESWHDCNPYDTDHVWGGNGGSNTNTILMDPERTDIVWANFQIDRETAGALMKSTNKGENYSWQESNTGLVGKIHLYDLTLDHFSDINNRTLYITADGDIYKSIDDGSTWSLIFANGGLKFIDINPVNHNLIYAGGENGLWQSMDGGNSWNEIGTPEMHGNVQGDILEWQWKGVFDIHCSPNDNGVVFVVVFGQDGGLFKSSNDGANWTKVYDNNYLRSVSVHPDYSSIVYISSSANYYSGGYNQGSRGMLFSQNGGNGGDWTEINDNLSWLNAGTIRIAGDGIQNIYAWSPGVGLIKSEAALIVDNIDLQQNINIQIFPNPAKDKIYIKNFKGEASIKIFNPIGQMISNQLISNSQIGINISTWPKGIYFIQIKDADKIYNSTFVKN